MAHFADCWSHLARRTSHTVVPPLGAQKSRERCERSRCDWMACMKVNRGRLSCSKVFLSSVSNVNLCVCLFFCSVFCSCSIRVLFCSCILRSVYRSVFCSFVFCIRFKFVFRFCITNESDDGFEDEIESYVTVTQSRSCGSKVLDSI